MVDERKRLLPPRLDDAEEDGPFTCCPFPRINNKLLAKGTVLITVALERLAFYTVSGNLILFLNGTTYQWTSYKAIEASLFFLGISCIFFFLGGFIADTKFGRFRTIFAAFIIYIIGYTFFPILANKYVENHILQNSSAFFECGDKESQSPRCSYLIYVGLAIMGAGTGMVRANIAPFGADQLKGDTAHSTVVFFNWYYWSINVGTLVALGGIAYVQQDIPNDGFFHSYIVGVACLVVGLIIFCTGKCTYTYRKPVGSIFVNIYKVFREALRIRKRKTAQQYEHRLDFPSRGQAHLVESPKPPCLLDHAKFRYGGSFHDHSVEDIKQLGKILLVFVVLVPYWVVYYQMETTFLVQGLHMNLFYDSSKSSSCVNHSSNQTDIQSGDHPFGIVVAWLTLFDVVLLIILIPIMDRIIYPWMKQKGWNFNMERRIFVGLVFSLLAITAAGVLETFRLKSYWHSSDVTKNVTYYAADMSVLYQIPQYSLIGFSEIFTSIAGLEFASLVAPRSMKSSVMGLFYFFSGCGSMLGMALLYSFQGRWFFGSTDHGNINCRKDCYGSKGTCHLDFYFFFLGGLQLIGILLFFLVIKTVKLETVTSEIEVNTQRRPSSRIRRRIPPIGTGNFDNTSISDRPITPNAAHDTDDSMTTESVSSIVEDVDDNQRLLNNMANRNSVKRTIGKDRSGRIGGAVKNED